MPSSLSSLPRARGRSAAALAVVAAAALAGCSPLVSVENADVPQWRATALPTAGGAVLDDAGKILNRDRIIREAADVPAGTYTLTSTCAGGGKAFFAVSLNGTALTEAGGACNGSKETARITLPESGRLEISASSVDAPLLYAYRLAPEQGR